MPKRSVQDFEGASAAIKIIIKNKGLYVPGLAKKTGWRYKKIKQSEKKKVGGPKIRVIMELLTF